MSNHVERSAPRTELPLGEAVAAYVNSLSVEERSVSGNLLQRFVRWYGSVRAISSLSPADLDRYQEHLASQGVDASRYLAALKEFLAEAHRQGLTTRNLAPHVRLRKRSRDRTHRPEGGRTEAQVVEVTPAGYEALKLELQRLEEERPRVVEEVQRARADGDLRENAPYHAARQHLGEIEGRINQLRALLNAAVIVREQSVEKVGIGTKVTLLDLDEDEEVVYTIVGPGEVDPRRGRISIQSPVGQALAERRVGDEVAVQAPGATVRFRILRIERAG